MCKVCSSLGQKWGNERAITGSKLILTCPLLILSKIFKGVRAGESHVTSFKQNCSQLQVNKNSEDGKNHVTRFKQNCLQVNKNSEDEKNHVRKIVEAEESVLCRKEENLSCA